MVDGAQVPVNQSEWPPHGAIQCDTGVLTLMLPQI